MMYFYNIEIGKEEETGREGKEKENIGTKGIKNQWRSV